MHAGGLLDADSQLEEDACQLRIIGVRDGVGGEEGVDAKILGTLCSQLLVAVDHLLLGHAVLGVAGLVHDLEALFALAQLEHAAGIKAAGDLFGDIADGILQKVDVGDVVQVDGGPQLGGQGKLLSGGVVGREHDLVPGKSAAVGHHQLGEGGAVHAASLLPQDLQDLGVWGGLDGEELPVAGVPGESLVQAAGILPDSLFIIDMKRCGIFFCDLFDHFFGNKCLFFHKYLLCIYLIYSNALLISSGVRVLR